MVSAIVISIVFALIFATLLQFVFRRSGPGPGGGILFLFVIIFLFAWVGGSRVTPFGPEYWGTSWLAYAAVAFFIMLLLAAILPAKPKAGNKISSRLTSDEVKAEVEAQTVISVTFGFFFWILIITLLILGLTGAFYGGEPMPVDNP